MKTKNMTDWDLPGRRVQREALRLLDQGPFYAMSRLCYHPVVTGMFLIN